MVDTFPSVGPSMPTRPGARSAPEDSLRSEFVDLGVRPAHLWQCLRMAVGDEVDLVLTRVPIRTLEKTQCQVALTAPSSKRRDRRSTSRLARAQQRPTHAHGRVSSAARRVRSRRVPVESFLRVRHAHARGCERGGHAPSPRTHMPPWRGWGDDLGGGAASAANPGARSIGHPRRSVLWQKRRAVGDEVDPAW
jgi:hypothetical protein